MQEQGNVCSASPTEGFRGYDPAKSMSLIFQAQLCLVRQTGSPEVHQLGASEGIKNPKASGFQNLLA